MLVRGLRVVPLQQRAASGVGGALPGSSRGSRGQTVPAAGHSAEGQRLRRSREGEKPVQRTGWHPRSAPQTQCFDPLVRNCGLQSPPDDGA